ncbi:TetR/AcrR family transcriptional regulator [Salinispora arenicola]|uniref:TetR/AcrR family transcriptional regulator n=1 Tax=Salinispora arenicola TaxID=168697 RepID=UPI0003700D33|nr:TetR/AcrR family transcriptional regulator [Salinispora arenicola]
MPRVSEDHRAARRQQILAAAAARFARDGFHRTSMQDVVDESGMSFGAVYRYFRTKNDIVMAISLEAISMIETVVRDGVQAGRPVADLMAKLPRALLTLEQIDERMRLAVQAWGEALRDQALAERMQSGLRRARAALKETIDVSYADSDVHIDAEAASQVLISIIQGFILQRAWDPHLDADSYGQAAQALIAGTLGRTGPEQPTPR